jgi:hypothetical protein
MLWFKPIISETLDAFYPCFHGPSSRLTTITRATSPPDSTFTTIMNLKCKPALSPLPSQFLVYSCISSSAKLPPLASPRLAHCRCSRLGTDNTEQEPGPRIHRLCPSLLFWLKAQKLEKFSRRLCARRTPNSFSSP